MVDSSGHEKGPEARVPVQGMTIIRDGFPRRQVTTALAVYVVLKEIENEHRSHGFPFCTSQSYIAKKACVTKPTVIAVTKRLAALCLVRVTSSRDRSGRQKMHTYELLDPTSMIHLRRGNMKILQGGGTLPTPSVQRREIA